MMAAAKSEVTVTFNHEDRRRLDRMAKALERLVTLKEREQSYPIRSSVPRKEEDDG